MPKVLSILFCLFIAGLPTQSALAQVSENYYAQLDKVWQMGSCNCYIFSISLWASTADDRTAATSKLHEFKLMNGAECRDLQEPTDQPPERSAVSLNEVKNTEKFYLQVVSQSKMRQYKDLTGLYKYDQTTNEYPYITLKTTVFKEKDSSGPSAFAISLLSNLEDTDRKKGMVADIYFFEDGVAQ